MFKEVYFFELRYGLKKPAPYLFASLLFVLALLHSLIASGIFNTPWINTSEYINSAFSISKYLISSNAKAFNLLNSIILITLMATSVQKDYEYNIFPLYFSKPITKASYFGGRVLGSFTIVVAVFLCSLLGYYLGCLIGVKSANVGDFRFLNLIQPFLIFTLPNIFLQGIIYFSLTTFLRNTLVAYLLAIIFVVIQYSSATIWNDYTTLAVLLDMSGESAFLKATRHWSLLQKNTFLIQLEKEILLNRMIWTLVALLIALYSFRRFSFTQYMTPFPSFKKKKRGGKLIISKYDTLADVVHPVSYYSKWKRIQQVGYLALIELNKTIKTPFFIIICTLGLAIVIIGLIVGRALEFGDTYPLTYIVISKLDDGFQGVLNLFIIFYSGSLIWKDKEFKIDEIVGVTSTENSTLFFSKFFALMGSVLIVLLLSVITGISIQMLSGFWQIQISLYLLFVFEKMIVFGIISIFCLAVQAVVYNKYIGFFFSMIPIVFLSIVFNVLHIDNPLLHFNSSGEILPYSDMNSFGGKFYVWFWYKLYWFAWALFVSVIGILFYFRGYEKSLRKRLKLNLGKPKALLFTVIFFQSLVIMASAVYIQQQNKNNSEYLEGLEVQNQKEQLLHQYQYLEWTISPRVDAVFAEIDIFPNKKSLNAQVDYSLSNHSNQAIDTLVVHFNADPADRKKMNYHTLKPVAEFSIIDQNDDLGILVIQLKDPLLPGDSLKFNMGLEYKQVSDFTSDEKTVVKNGTFFTSQYFISFGYANSKVEEINNSEKQSKANLEGEINDEGRIGSYSAIDWVAFEAIVSTSADQIALAPGQLIKEWEDKGRRYFHYKTINPMLNLFSIQSARYKQYKDEQEGVGVEIYYHKDHEYNIVRIAESAKASLAYYIQQFGPYRYRQIRITEFPRYQSLVQSYPNMISYSESDVFIMKVDEKNNDVDIPFYHTAREMSRQWWAQQSSQKNREGSDFLTMALSEYSALMVMEKVFGREGMRVFLKHEQNEYLMEVNNRQFEEFPLRSNKKQPTIYYSKGGLAFYALRDYLGEERLNEIIRQFKNTSSSNGGLYNISIELIDEIEQALPDSLQYLIGDLFDNITLYENFVKNVEYEEISDGRFKVIMTVASVKFYLDSAGKMNRAETMNDYIDVGVFGKDIDGQRKELVLEKIKMDGSEKTLVYYVNEQPESAGIDPYLKLIDRKFENNLVNFGSHPPSANLDDKKNIRPGLGRK